MNLLTPFRLTLTIITSLLFILIIISGSLNFIVRYDFIYDYNIATYSIDERTSLNLDKIKEINFNIKTYFFDENELLDVDIYSDKEILHMKDVKHIMNLIFNLGKILSIVFCVFIFLLHSYFEVHLNKVIFYSVILFSSILILLGVSFLLFFQEIFIIFHKIAFNNDLWILNPNTDYLLMMFPEDFFRDVAVLILLSSFLLNVIVYFLFRKLSFRSK
ncbi:MAG: TIGR01906 family membrane protein [Dehalococcoidia bacterium]|nr:TIGR01906 family membrane protein [Dehalococcoidia bacterium]|tara:strand:+ start:482 stop:1132 length:651 start_codon:yes stop_codon:yes gene_type:complete